MTKKIYLELSEDAGSSHKFYEVVIDDCTVTIRYGRIGTDGTSSTQTLSSHDEALKFGDKKAKEKMKKGYEEAVVGVRQKRTVTRRQIESKPPAAKTKKSPIVWRFRSTSTAFGIFISEDACWLGNQSGQVFKPVSYTHLTLPTKRIV